MTSPADGRRRRAAVVGTGLVGGSIGLALRDRGWYVTGRDRDPQRAEAALARGAIDAVGQDPDAEVTFVATPVGAVAAEVAAALRHGGVVTDVGSVKSSIVARVDDPNFVGGHPMAGSELAGVEGADAELFARCAWVLTPVAGTDPGAHSLVRSVVTSLGAEVLELAPADHDALVAVVSHVPHLTAAALMGLAADRAEANGALLRLAAGGFRDMTRVAGGDPGIWPDICSENASAIVELLSALEGTLASLRHLVKGGDREGLLVALRRAQEARVHLPGRVSDPGVMTELRVPVPDRPGVLADITTLATELGVNIDHLEIVHSSEGEEGVVILLVRSDRVLRLGRALIARGYVPSTRRLQ
ncbi:MAG TPA: prephenate dehydrogenase/arogenate dehydrogenase family protein [Acidimicrobiales bacterium]|jgi:prephenate dehydrogenase|nr:prephenate dehydrogenase/arogenate dehydrogenase family protein [Acidimicrobiales bacterium]